MKQQISIFIINLKKDIAKKKHMQRLCERYNLNYKFIEAVDGRTLSNEEVSQVYSSNMAMQESNRELVLGEIGCALSHISIYEQMVNEQIPYSVILEDDIIFDSKFVEFIEILNDLPENWDCVLLNYYRKSPLAKLYCLSLRERISLSKTLKVVRFIELMHSTAGYVLSLSGANKLLVELTKGLIKPIDHYTGDEEILNLYGILPQVIEIDPVYGIQSNIEKERNQARSISQSAYPKNWLKIYLKKSRLLPYIKRLNRKRIELFYCLPKIIQCLSKPKVYDS